MTREAVLARELAQCPGLGEVRRRQLEPRENGQFLVAENVGQERQHDRVAERAKDDAAFVALGIAVDLALDLGCLHGRAGLRLESYYRSLEGRPVDQLRTQDGQQAMPVEGNGLVDVESGIAHAVEREELEHLAHHPCIAFRFFAFGIVLRIFLDALEEGFLDDDLVARHHRRRLAHHLLDDVVVDGLGVDDDVRRIAGNVPENTVRTAENGRGAGGCIRLLAAARDQAERAGYCDDSGEMAAVA